MDQAHCHLQWAFSSSAYDLGAEKTPLKVLNLHFLKPSSVVNLFFLFIRLQRMANSYIKAVTLSITTF